MIQGNSGLSEIGVFRGMGETSGYGSEEIYGGIERGRDLFNISTETGSSEGFPGWQDKEGSDEVNEQVDGEEIAEQNKGGKDVTGIEYRGVTNHRSRDKGSGCDNDMLRQIWEMLNGNSERLEKNLKLENRRLETKLDRNTESLEQMRQDNEAFKVDIKCTLEVLNKRVERNELQCNEGLKTLEDRVDVKLVSITEDFNEKLEDCRNEITEKLDEVSHFNAEAEIRLDGEIGRIDKKVEDIRTCLGNFKKEMQVNSQKTIKKIIDVEVKQELLEKEIENKIEFVNSECRTELDNFREKIEQQLGTLDRPNEHEIVKYAREVIPEFKIKVDYDNPMRAIEQLDSYIKTYKITEWESIRGILDNNFNEVPRVGDWWLFIVESINNYEQFKEKFQNKFWNENIQFKVREELRFNKFSTGGPLSLSEYFIKKYNIAKYLTPKFTDKEILNFLIRHYDDNIKTAYVMRNINSSDEFIEMLEGFSNQDLYKRKNMGGQIHNRQIDRGQGQNRISGREIHVIREVRPNQEKSSYFTQHNNNNNFYRAKEGDRFRQDNNRFRTNYSQPNQGTTKPYFSNNQGQPGFNGSKFDRNKQGGTTYVNQNYRGTGDFNKFSDKQDYNRKFYNKEVGHNKGTIQQGTVQGNSDKLQVEAQVHRPLN